MGTQNMRRQDDLMVEYKVLITEGCYVDGKLLDGTDRRILLDTGVSKSFMLEGFYLNCPNIAFFVSFCFKNQMYIFWKGPTC